MLLRWLTALVATAWLVVSGQCSGLTLPLTGQQVNQYKNKIVSMFYHSYESYLKYASNYDELQPISCQGTDTWGQFSLSLIDALDTLAVLGNYTEFRRVAQHVANTADFNTNINVSVFETNIRVIGGLLSAHLLSRKAGVETEPGWPCEGPLLRLAEDAARRLLPAFESRTGMPYGTVNLRYGVPENETPITCTAGVGTYVLEFGTLSRLTGDPIFEAKALKAIHALHNSRSKIGLVGNHINVEDGKWTATESGIGGGVDSYFEYLVKGAMLLQMPQLMQVFYDNYQAINKYIRKEDWYVWVQMTSGTPTMPIFQSLEAFWPGVLTLIGDIDQAKKTIYNYHQVWKQYGFTPEFYDIPNSKSNSKRDGYPLRPEFIESVLYLYRATKDPHLLHIGADVIDAIESSARTECGFATVKSVGDHTIEDRMESFFLAETLKYLYLLFDESNFVHNDGSKGSVIDTNGNQCIVDTGSYVFNTEAHLIDIGAVDCCSGHRKNQMEELTQLRESLNLFSLLDDNENPFKLLDNSKHLTKTSDQMPATVSLGGNLLDPNETVGNQGFSETSKTVPSVTSVADESLDSVQSVSDNEKPMISESVGSQTQNIVYENVDLFSPTLESSLNPSDIPSVEKTNSQNIYSTNQSTIVSQETEELQIRINSTSEPTQTYAQTSADTISSPEDVTYSESYDGWHSKSSDNEPKSDETMISVVSDNTIASDGIFGDIPKNNESTKDSMLFSSENITSQDFSDMFTDNYELLLCPSQPFLSRLTNFGQMLV